MRRTCLALAIAAALTVAGAGTAAAQSGFVNATATVLTPLTVSPVSDLAFGNVYPGVAKTIAYSDATNGGKFSIAGYDAAQVNLTFTLPTDLSDGTNTLPIGTWTGYYNTANNATAGGSTFTPAAAATTTNLAAGVLYVFIGATVTPAGNQVAGSYTNTVTMNAAYTGL
jgi:hypothetical protein